MIDLSNQKTTIEILVEEEVIKEAEKLFQKLDLTMSNVIHLFLQQAVLNQEMPFKIQK